MSLLGQVKFDPLQDQLWLTGDLVNRGPRSLAVLRFVKSLGSAATVVLGNHDLHLLARHYVGTLKERRRDTLNDVLNAPDRDDLMEWLRQQPLLHHDAHLSLTMVHAGLPPQWSLEQAQALALEVETQLQGPMVSELLAGMYGDLPTRWHPELTGAARLRYILNGFTRIRFVTRQGELNLQAKGSPKEHAPRLLPWFAVSQRASYPHRVVFGHWSTLRLSAAEENRYNVLPLDTGAIWGGELTAWCAESGARFQVRGGQPAAP
ncbi:MAG: symmetrical bis(5'-nucleosyl)-tetraphosphatase [Gammaproteobacteria bacterium]|nr:symmetrical bis(5'-nucleosyl)-tetraphosphatase [Gammaproteobacteria bacterium]